MSAAEETEAAPEFARQPPCHAGPYRIERVDEREAREADLLRRAGHRVLG